MYVTFYRNEILIYLDMLDKNRVHVRSILHPLSGAGLHLKAEKYEFHKEEVRYLRLIIRRVGVKMDPNMVAILQD